MEPEDLDLIYQIENMTEFWRMGAANVPYSRYAIHRFIAENRNNLFADGQLRLMIEKKDTRETVGCIDLTAFEPLHRRAETGLLILPKFQHRGLGHNALSVLCHYAHSFLQLHQLYAYVAVTNTPAIRLFSSCSFRSIGTLPDWICHEETFRPVHLFQRIFSDTKKNTAKSWQE